MAAGKVNDIFQAAPYPTLLTSSILIILAKRSQAGWVANISDPEYPITGGATLLTPFEKWPAKATAQPIRGPALNFRLSENGACTCKRVHHVHTITLIQSIPRQSLCNCTVAVPSSAGHRRRLAGVGWLAPAVDFLRVYNCDGGDVDDVFDLRTSRQQMHGLAHAHEDGADRFQAADF